MKQQKLSGYQPNYPKRIVKGMALAAAALVAIGSTTGCRMLRPQIMGDVPIEEPGVEETLPPEEIRTEGVIAIDDMETPTPPAIMGTPGPISEPPMTTGLPAITPTPEPEDLVLMGDVAVFEP